MFGVRNTTSLLLGILLAVIYCIVQITSYNSRKRKGYSVESPYLLGIRLVVIAAGIIWLFSILANYRGVPMVFITLGIILIAYSYFTSSTVAGRHLYALGK